MGMETTDEGIQAQLAEYDRIQEIEMARLYHPEQLEELEAEEPRYSPPTKKDMLSVNGTKSEFVKGIYKWLLATLDKVGNGEYKDMFKIEGSSIMCSLPDNYFSHYSIPHGTKIEMKFITKKG